MKVLNLANQLPDSDLNSNEDDFLQRAEIPTAVPLLQGPPFPPIEK